MNESNDNEQAAKAAWRSQALDAPQLTLQFVRHQADRLDRDRRREMHIAWGSLAACIVLIATILLNPHGAVTDSMTQTLRLTGVALLAGCAYQLYQLNQRSRAVSAQMDGLVTCLVAYRTELRRRRALYHDAWRWSIWPILPALLVVFVGGGPYDDRPGKLWRYGACTVIAVIGFGLGTIHYRRKGDQLQHELEALTSMDEQ